MIYSIDKNTRIKLKFHLPALGIVYCLQRKYSFMWITKSWIYPSLVNDKGFDYVIHWLLWEENLNVDGTIKKSKKLMKQKQLQNK